MSLCIVVVRLCCWATSAACRRIGKQGSCGSMKQLDSSHVAGCHSLSTLIGVSARHLPVISRHADVHDIVRLHVSLLGWCRQAAGLLGWCHPGAAASAGGGCKWHRGCMYKTRWAAIHYDIPEHYPKPLAARLPKHCGLLLCDLRLLALLLRNPVRRSRELSKVA